MLIKKLKPRRKRKGRAERQKKLPPTQRQVDFLKSLMERNFWSGDLAKLRSRYDYSEALEVAVFNMKENVHTHPQTNWHEY
jgi:hypothetical protein